MKRVVRVKLTPNSEQAQLLAATLHACNQAANDVSAYAHENPGASPYMLRARTYQEVKNQVPGAQAAQQVIRKVVQARKARRANLRAGNYGPKGSHRYNKALSRVISFRPDAAQPYDDRILSWKHDQRTVSIWTLEGRQTIKFTGRGSDLDLLRHYRKGETDLVMRGARFYLYATIDLPDPATTTPCGFIGVDMGIVQIATTATSDGQPGQSWAGGEVIARRRRNRRLRSRLQKKGTKSAKRLLRKRALKEARYATDVNHRVSKKIVAEAQRTGRGIAVENLTGIRSRVRQRKPQRATLHSWAFAQLGQFVAYKAQAAGVAFIQVDPAHTSQQCSGCGNIDPKNRQTQADFTCTSCGISLNADTNAAINIARRGVDDWAAANLPYAA